jgi:predicted RNA binding protein YcfA (HicA-like mRNA interferase family)
LALAKKIRQLIKDLTDAGFYEIQSGGKGSHRKFTHVRYSGAMTLSGKIGDDVKPYQERQVQRSLEEVLK